MADVDLPVMMSLSPEPDSPKMCSHSGKLPAQPSFCEEADLIEILWKQDIDIGIPRDHFLSNVPESPENIFVDQDVVTIKGKPTKDKCEEKEKGSKDEKKDDSGNASDDDPWAGLSYRVDDETGEYILLDASDVSSDSGCETNSSQLFTGPTSQTKTSEDEEADLDKSFGYVDLATDAFGEENLTESNFTLGASGLELVGTHDPVLCSIAAPSLPKAAASRPPAFEAQEDSDPVDDQPSFDETDIDLALFLNDVRSADNDDEDKPSSSSSSSDGSSSSSSPSAGRPSPASPTDSIEELSAQLEASLEDMIQTAQMHPRSLQVRMPLMRTMSMEHRWQDLANFLSLPDGAAAAAAAANLGSHPGHPHHGGHHAVHHSHHGTHPHHGMHSLGHHSPHPFVHPGYATHGSVHPHHHNASPAHHGYGVHPAAPTAHHAGYGGLPSAAAPVSSYPNAANAGADVSGRAALLQNASIASPLTDIGGNGTYPTSNLASGLTLGSAVTASMNITNSTDSLESNNQVTYKTEVNDMHLYYQQNNNTEVNQNGDGFFPSIFNEDDLNLMDMAITDTMYTPRMLENQTLGHNIGIPGANNNGATGIANAVIDTTNDSAVSSMGSERGHSISEAGATAVLPTASTYGMEFSKYRHYEYSGFSSRSGMDGVNGANRSGNPPVAQKKHQMFGKRIFQEQGDTPGSPSVNTASSPAKFDYGNGTSGNGLNYSHPATPLDASSNMSSMDMKYGCGLDFNVQQHDARGVDHVTHNHTYALGAEANGASQRPISRDKSRGASTSSLRSSISESASTPGAGTSGSSSESEAYSRDEKRARAMNIPMTVDDIINLPMDEFNERLSKYDLTEPQLSLIRDIRRRGKNKVAAQNCRKRKLDQILTLADEVKRARERKSRLLKERDFLVAEKAKMKDRFAQLYRHVFQSLRDPDGQPYSSYEYSLQQSADGNILLVPRAAAAAHGGTPIDPQPTLHSAIQHSSQHQPMQLHHHHHMSGQRPLVDPMAINMPGTSCSVNGSATSVVQHGARRKTPDHSKNEP